MTNYTKLLNIILFVLIALNLKGQEIQGEIGCIFGDCINGYGVYLYPDGSKYQGDFRKGQADGYGVCYYADEDWYVGEWANHTFHGEGKYHVKGKEVIEGVWEYGSLMRKTNVSPYPTNNEVPMLKSKIWVIIIGVAAYTDVMSLKYTDDDAYKLYSFLKSPEGGAIPDDNIMLLIDEAATKNRIQKSIKEVVEKADTADSILLFMSGHGEKGRFLPHDYRANSDISMSYDYLITEFSKSKAKHKLIIADVCFAGSMGSEMAARSSVDNTISAYYEALKKSKGGFALILSSSNDEQSIENKGIRQGVFSYFLIEGLRGKADFNGDLIITVEEIFNFTKSKVQYYTNFHQNPVISGNYDADTPLAVIRR